MTRIYCSGMLYGSREQNRVGATWILLAVLKISRRFSYHLSRRHLSHDHAMFGCVGCVNHCTLLRRFSGGGLDRDLRLHQRPMAPYFTIPHCDECKGDGKPIEIVRYDGAVGCGVRPSKYSIKDTPATSTIDFGTATL